MLGNTLQRRRLARFGFCLAIWLSTLALADDALRLENPWTRLEFDGDRGNFTAWTESASQTSYLSAAAGTEGRLWEIQFLAPGAAPLKPSDAASFTWRRREGAAPTLELTWRDFGREDAPDLAVCAEMTLDAEAPAAYWAIRIEGLSALRPATVIFPRIASLRPLPGETLAVPVWMGEKTSRFRELLNPPGAAAKRFEWEYPGLLSMQCLSLSQSAGPGIYLAVDDSSTQRKHFAVFGDGADGAGLEVIHFPEFSGDPAPSYAPPYRVILSAVEGDWTAAAARYRTWALEQPWAKASRLRNGAVPDWVLDTGLWVWNRGRSENVLGPAQVLQERAQVPVSVFWHWWHGCAYDAGFPEYLPPREGAEAFQHAMNRAHGANIHAIVYMNQRLWCMTTESWEKEQAARYAVKGPDGAIRPEVYNTFTKTPCASMCMGTPFWRATYAGLAERAIKELLVDGIYMDQACSSLACYDPAHGHPLGGGAFWMEGFRLLSADIRTRCAASGPVTLAGEGCGEAWLPYLDLMLSLQVSMERYAQPGNWEPIPFFHSVYHGYAIFYGNYSSLTAPPYDELWPAETAPEKPLALLDRKFARQFYLEQARAFVWGQQPTLANFRPEHFESRAEEISFVLHLARLRRHALKYLLHGMFAGLPPIEAPRDTLDMSRLSIYAGQQGAVREFRQEHPLILAALWRAPDGDVALVAANIGNEPYAITFDALAGEWGLPATGNVYRLDETGRHWKNRYEDGRIHVRVDLAPRSAAVYEYAL